MRKVLSFLLIITIVSCKTETAIQKLKLGKYRATLEVLDNEELPFIFEVKSDNKLTLFNAEEVIEDNSISYRNDSVFINFPVFEGYIAAVFEDDNLKGSYIKESLDRIVPFYAEFNNGNRFKTLSDVIADATGIWETKFTKSDGSEYIAKSIFKQEGNKVTGTIRTTTGDYRYLEGIMNGNVMKFSAFDGAHAFLFTATVSDSTLQGVFYSGNHSRETFVAKRNEAYGLPSEDSLTFLKEGYDTFAFSFPDADGNMVSLGDAQFKDKVVLVQIMGTWCPNCLDETRYYKTFYDANKNKDIAFVALAFEYAKTKEKAFAGIQRLKDRVGIEYPILLAQFGSSDKDKAQEKLPMLNHVLSYPTTVFIDKKGKVRKIHTGFNGPATGEKYVSFQKEFAAFINELLAE
jgi:thiol-disulfide isomerase/thioredoxin